MRRAAVDSRNTYEIGSRFISIDARGNGDKKILRERPGVHQVEDARRARPRRAHEHGALDYEDIAR